MKKIMIAVAIVCAAVMTQAATVKWQSGTMSGVTTAGAVTGYLFELTASQYSTYSALDAADLSAKLYGDYKDSLGSAQANGQNVVKKGVLLRLTSLAQRTTPLPRRLMRLSSISILLTRKLLAMWLLLRFPRLRTSPSASCLTKSAGRVGLPLGLLRVLSRSRRAGFCSSSAWLALPSSASTPKAV